MNYNIYWKCSSISYHFLKRYAENRLVKTVKFLLSSVKLINLMRIYLHITESYACILKIFAGMRRFPLNF